MKVNAESAFFQHIHSKQFKFNHHHCILTLKTYKQRQLRLITAKLQAMTYFSNRMKGQKPQIYFVVSSLQ